MRPPPATSPRRVARALLPREGRRFEGRNSLVGPAGPPTLGCRPAASVPASAAAPAAWPAPVPRSRATLEHPEELLDPRRAQRQPLEGLLPRLRGGLQHLRQQGLHPALVLGLLDTPRPGLQTAHPQQPPVKREVPPPRERAAPRAIAALLERPQPARATARSRRFGAPKAGKGPRASRGACSRPRRHSLTAPA